MLNGKPLLYFQTSERNGCNFYRLVQPATEIIKRNIFPCAISDTLNLLEDQTMWIDKCDVLISQNGWSEKYLDYMLEHQKDKRFILDFDDDPFDLSPYNPAYKDFGITEVKVEMNGEEKMLWQDGKDGFDIERNKKKLFIFTECLKAAHLVTCPSPILAGLYKKKGARRTLVIKNLVNFKTWYPIKMAKDGNIRIGYQGGWSHYDDWQEIAGVLEEVMAKYNNTKLVIMGQAYHGMLKNLPKDRVTVEPWRDVDIYPWVMKTLNIDIGIAPLRDGLFNSCKSEIKWEEYSALEIPTIASQRPPYSLAIDHNRTGLLAVNKQEWIDQISLLIENYALRKRIGETAREKVFKDYNLETKIWQYKDAIDSLFGLRRIISHVFS